MGTSGIQRASFEEARRLGHDWAGPEHGLLAILRGDASDVARRVLEEVGMDAGMVERQLQRKEEGIKDKRRGVLANPAWQHMFGRAEGFAACLGTGELEPVHLLLALLWDERFWQFAEQQGESRDAVFEALARAGVALPSAPIPELERPVVFPPGGPPSTCQFCGGPIPGSAFVVPVKDRSWTAFFCSPPCSLGFGVCALAAGGRVRGVGQPALAEEFGTSGSWYRSETAPGPD